MSPLVHDLTGPVPPCRIVKEKRATFAATPAQDARRPPARTAWANLFLAGDWTDTGLPATIEGALRSGETAAGSRSALGGAMTQLERSSTGLEGDIDRAAQALLRRAARRRPLGLRAGGRRHDPGGIRPAAPLSRRAGRSGAGAQDRRLSAPHPGRAWRLAAVPRRRLRHQRVGEGLFLPEDDRRQSRRAAHGEGARRPSWPTAAPSRANVFTRILLAQFGELSWAHVPTMPVEIILLPRWFPIHLSRMSYWARTVIVPLLVLAALRKRARNPRGIGIQELFATADRSPPRRRCASAPRLGIVLQCARPGAEGGGAAVAEERCVGAPSSAASPSSPSG